MKLSLTLTVIALSICVFSTKEVSSADSRIRLGDETMCPSDSGLNNCLTFIYKKSENKSPRCHGFTLSQSGIIQWQYCKERCPVMFRRTGQDLSSSFFPDCCGTCEPMLI